MTVYVDRLRYEPQYRCKICRMRSTDREALLQMAQMIGAVRHILPGKPREHFVLDVEERTAALELGAVVGMPPPPLQAGMGKAAVAVRRQLSVEEARANLIAAQRASK